MAGLLRKAGRVPWARNEEGTEHQDSGLQNQHCVNPEVFNALNNRVMTCNTDTGSRRTGTETMGLSVTEHFGKGNSQRLWEGL